MNLKVRWCDYNVLEINRELLVFPKEDEIDREKIRALVEPWSSAIFQSEHLFLIIGSGFKTALTQIAGTHKVWGVLIFEE